MSNTFEHQKNSSQEDDHILDTEVTNNDALSSENTQPSKPESKMPCKDKKRSYNDGKASFPQKIGQKFDHGAQQFAHKSRTFRVLSILGFVMIVGFISNIGHHGRPHHNERFRAQEQYMQQGMREEGQMRRHFDGQREDRQAQQSDRQVPSRFEGQRPTDPRAQ